MGEQLTAHQNLNDTRTGFQIEDCCEKIKAICSVLAESDPQNFRDGALWRITQLIEDQANEILSIVYPREQSEAEQAGGNA